MYELQDPVSHCLISWPPQFIGSVSLLNKMWRWGFEIPKELGFAIGCDNLYRGLCRFRVERVVEL